MTTATAPRLPGDAYAGVQHRGSPHADHRLGGVGNTKVVAQPAVRAPAERRPAPAQSGAPAFGQTHVDENGDEMTVSAPVAYTPGKYAVGGEGHRDDQERVGAAVNPTIAHLTASSGGQEGDQDGDDKVASSPDTTVLPGKTIKWDAAFGAQSLDDRTIKGSPGFAYDHMVWSS